MPWHAVTLPQGLDLMLALDVSKSFWLAQTRATPSTLFSALILDNHSSQLRMVTWSLLTKFRIPHRNLVGHLNTVVELLGHSKLFHPMLEFFLKQFMDLALLGSKGWQKVGINKGRSGAVYRANSPARGGSTCLPKKIQKGFEGTENAFTIFFLTRNENTH